MPSYRPGSRHPSQNSLAGWCKLPKHSQQAHRRQRLAPSSKSMNSALSSLKKVPMLALDSGGLHLWQGPGLLSVEEGRSKPVEFSGSRSSTFRRWAMAQTCWRSTRISSHTPSITRERPSPPKSNHWTADSGIIWPGSIVKCFATANPKPCWKYP